MAIQPASSPMAQKIQFARTCRQGIRGKDRLQAARQQCDQAIAEKTQEVVQALLHRQQNAKAVLANLTDEMEALEPLEPSRRHIQHLTQMNRTLKMEQERLGQAFEESREYLLLQQQQKRMLGQQLHHMADVLHKGPHSFPFEGMLLEAGSRLSARISDHFAEAPSTALALPASAEVRAPHELNRNILKEIMP